MKLHANARTCPKSRALIARSRTCCDPRERGASGTVSEFVRMSANGIEVSPRFDGELFL